jgi:hypothetical protein
MITPTLPIVRFQTIAAIDTSINILLEGEITTSGRDSYG